MRLLSKVMSTFLGRQQVALTVLPVPLRNLSCHAFFLSLLPNLSMASNGTALPKTEGRLKGLPGSLPHAQAVLPLQGTPDESHSCWLQQFGSPVASNRNAF